MADCGSIGGNSASRLAFDRRKVALGEMGLISLSNEENVEIAVVNIKTPPYRIIDVRASRLSLEMFV